jgi:AcrR family transcriptional regulator
MTTETSPRSRNPRGSGAQLRTAIIAAAIQLIDEAGDASRLTLRGVARQAGISAPSIYAHFADLDEVIDAVLSASFDELLASTQKAMAAEPDPVASLIAAAQAYVQFGWAHRPRYRLMFAATGFAPDAVATFSLVEEGIRSCVESGRSSSTDPHADAFLVWVGVHGMATLEKPDRETLRRLGPLDRPQLLNEMVTRLARIDTSLVE